MKLPGTSLMYGIFMFIFGRTATGIHWGFLFMNAATMYLLYAAFKKIFNSFAALTASVIYGFMAVGGPFSGFAAHATHFICFYSSIAFLLLAGYMQSGKPLKLFLFGLMLGIAFLMKQQAVFLMLFGAAFLAFYLKTEKKQSFLQIIKKLLLFGAGASIPYIIIFLIIAFTGQFNVFWLWTVKYASQYEAVKSLHMIAYYFKTNFQAAWDLYNYLFILAFAGILVLYWSPYTRLQKLFALGYFIASGCLVSSGFYFRQHYFIVILPVIGLLTGIFIEFLIKQMKERITILKSPNASLIILSVIVLVIIGSNFPYFFSDPAKKVSTMAYWGNPFTEAPEISKYIKDNTADTDKIAVLGSEPEIYFYANRRAATGYLYTYPLVDNQPYNEIMQDQMIKEIEENKPAIIIFCNISYSWIKQPGTPDKIFTWGHEYTDKNYTPVCFIDFFTDTGWHYLWGDDIKKHSPEATSFMILFKRNPKQGI